MQINIVLPLNSITRLMCIWNKPIKHYKVCLDDKSIMKYHRTKHRVWLAKFHFHGTLHIDICRNSFAHSVVNSLLFCKRNFALISNVKNMTKHCGANGNSTNDISLIKWNIIMVNTITLHCLWYTLIGISPYNFLPAHRMPWASIYTQWWKVWWTQYWGTGGSFHIF